MARTGARFAHAPQASSQGRSHNGPLICVFSGGGCVQRGHQNPRTSPAVCLRACAVCYPQPGLPLPTSSLSAATGTWASSSAGAIKAAGPVPGLPCCLSVSSSSLCTAVCCVLGVPPPSLRPPLPIVPPAWPVRLESRYPPSRVLPATAAAMHPSRAPRLLRRMLPTTGMEKSSHTSCV